MRENTVATLRVIHSTREVMLLNCHIELDPLSFMNYKSLYTVRSLRSFVYIFYFITQRGAIVPNQTTMNGQHL